MLKTATSDVDSRESLLTGALRGLVWSYASYVAARSLSFLSTIVLARLLVPEEFGQFAIALLVVSYLETFGSFGVSAALIYERKEPERGANVAFLLSLLSGFILMVVVTTSAPMIAQFFRDGEIEPLLRAMAWLFLLGSFGNTHDALLRKSLHFKKRFVPEMVRSGLKAFFAICLALSGMGVWSLVWGQIIGTAAATFALWFLVPWRPKFDLTTQLIKRMLKYGFQIVFVNVLAAVVHHVDYLIVGRVLGTAALGFYTLAYRIPELVINMVVWAVGNVTFPAYSSLQEDKPALRSAYLATQRYLSLLTLPAGLGLALLSGPAIHTLYGEDWGASVPVLQALGLAASVRSLGSHAGDVYKATGRPEILTKLALVRAALLIPSLIYATRYGIEGVAIGLLLVTAVSTCLSLFVASRILDLKLKSILVEFKPALTGCAVMAAVLLPISILSKGWPELLRLMVLGSIGSSVYAYSVWRASRETLEKAHAALNASFRKVAGATEL